MDPDNQFAQINLQKLPPTIYNRISEPIEPQAGSSAKMSVPGTPPAVKPTTAQRTKGLFGLDYQTTLTAGIHRFVLVILILFSWWSWVLLDTSHT